MLENARGRAPRARDAATALSRTGGEVIYTHWSTRLRHGTLRVMRYCFSGGRYGRAHRASPAAHCHVGHEATS